MREINYNMEIEIEQNIFDAIRFCIREEVGFEADDEASEMMKENAVLGDMRFDIGVGTEEKLLW